MNSEASLLNHAVVKKKKRKKGKHRKVKQKFQNNPQNTE